MCTKNSLFPMQALPITVMEVRMMTGMDTTSCGARVPFITTLTSGQVWPPPHLPPEAHRGKNLAPRSQTIPAGFPDSLDLLFCGLRHTDKVLGRQPLGRYCSLTPPPIATSHPSSEIGTVEGGSLQVSRVATKPRATTELPRDQKSCTCMCVCVCV